MTGLEPAIPGLGGRCLIHLATKADIQFGQEGRHLCNTFNEISEILAHLKIRLACQFILLSKLQYGVTAVELIL